MPARLAGGPLAPQSSLRLGRYSKSQSAQKVLGVDFENEVELEGLGLALPLINTLSDPQ